MKSHDENYNDDNITIIIRTLTFHTLSNISIISIKAALSLCMVFYKHWRFWPFGEVILKHSVHCHGRVLVGLAFVFSSKTSTSELFVAMEFLYSLITLSLVSFDVVFQIISVPTLQLAPVYKWRTLHSVHRSFFTVMLLLLHRPVAI